jgi:serine/threonine-protein kinase HipA
MAPPTQRVIMHRMLGAGTTTNEDPTARCSDLPPRVRARPDRGARLPSVRDRLRRQDDERQARGTDGVGGPDRARRSVSAALDQALVHASSVGGARPKALVGDRDRKLIAKFSSTTDPYPVVKGEYAAMELARRAGLDAAPVELCEVLGTDVILVDRFDRAPAGRRRWRFTDARRTLRELFGRIVFNILAGNSDDHARNHAAFWDGAALTLTPAYDICPQPRAGGETTQAMPFGADGFRMSQVAGAFSAAATYILSEPDAREIIDHQIDVISAEWIEVCDLARLTEVERAYFWRRQFLNPYALEGYRPPT